MIQIGKIPQYSADFFLKKSPMIDGVLPDFLLIKGPLLGVMQGYFNLQITTINNQINDVVEVNNYGWLFK